MSTTIYRTANDASAPSMTCTLSLDGTAIETDLSGEVVTCSLQNRADATDIIEIVATGGLAGLVTTPFPQAKLLEGTYTLEWEVTNSATYPGNKQDRPLLVVRAEVS